MFIADNKGFGLEVACIRRENWVAVCWRMYFENRQASIAKCAVHFGRTSQTSSVQCMHWSRHLRKAKLFTTCLGDWHRWIQLPNRLLKSPEQKINRPKTWNWLLILSIGMPLWQHSTTRSHWCLSLIYCREWVCVWVPQLLLSTKFLIWKLSVGWYPLGYSRSAHKYDAKSLSMGDVREYGKTFAFCAWSVLCWCQVNCTVERAWGWWTRYCYQERHHSN